MEREKKRTPIRDSIKNASQTGAEMRGKEVGCDYLIEFSHVLKERVEI